GKQGYFTVTAWTSATIVTANIISEIPGAANQYHSEWSREAFDDSNGPAHVTYHESRKVYATTNDSPQKVWLSRTFIYNDFGDSVDEGEDDDDIATDESGFDLELSTDQANEIKWLSSGESLATGTFGGEFTSVSPSGSSLTRKNKNSKRQSGWGSEFIKVMKMGNYVYYVQRGARRLRELFYFFDNDNYKSTDMTAL
ncbi:unnamed protein product, partial [marine sediment metagenome]